MVLRQRTCASSSRVGTEPSRRRYSLETTRCFGSSVGPSRREVRRMCSKKVFSLQFHAGKRRDDILKDPGTKTNVAAFCDDGFSQTPIISSQDKL